MGSSQTGSQSQSGSQMVEIPSFLRPYYTQTVQGLLNAQNSLPSATSLYNNMPTQGTAPLTAGTNQDINSLQTVANAGNNAATASGQQGLQNFVGGGAGTPSAATEAEINEFNTLQAPQILSSAALMGLGNSGAALTALSQGQESALVPFLQADQTNQLNASTQLGALGQQEAATQQGQIGNALTASQLPQQNTQEQLNALYNQQQAQSQYAQSIQTGGSSQFPALLGQTSFGGGSGSSPKF